MVLFTIVTGHTIFLAFYKVNIDHLGLFYFFKVNLTTVYTLFHEMFSTFFFNKISLPERRNKRKSVLEITKMYYLKI